MALEIVNAEGVPAPRDGTIFNAKFTDGKRDQGPVESDEGRLGGSHLEWPVAGARISTRNNAAQDMVAGVAARLSEQMTAPQRHWRSYGTDPLPTGQEAMDKPLNAFPSWFLRVECDRCGKAQMVNQVHMDRGDMPIRVIIAKMRHDGCGGRAEKAELLTGIEGESSRPVRRIVLREGYCPAGKCYAPVTLLGGHDE